VASGSSTRMRLPSGVTRAPVSNWSWFNVGSMLGGVCGSCDAGVPADAHYCPACGAAVHELTAGEPVGEFASAGGPGSELVVRSGAKQAVVLAVVALLVVLIGVSLLTSRQPSENVAPEPEEEEAPTAASTSTVVTTVPAATSVAVPVSDAAVPSTTGVDTRTPPPNVNVNRLPELEAAYIAAYGRGEVQFLDLATGEWSAVQLESGVAGVRTIDDGLVLTLPSGAIAFASPTSSELTRYPDEEQSLVVDVSRDLIIFGTQTRPQSVRARTTDGILQWATQLPESAQAVGLLDDGRLVLQVEQWVALMEVGSTRSGCLAMTS